MHCTVSSVEMSVCFNGQKVYITKILYFTKKALFWAAHGGHIPCMHLLLQSQKVDLNVQVNQLIF